MKYRYLLTIIGVLLFQSACSAPSQPTNLPPLLSPQPAVTREITRDALADTTYRTGMTQSGTVTLIDGSYEEKLAEGASGTMIVQLHDKFATGDLNADGQADAAVILVTKTGGTGTFYELAAALGQDDQLLPAGMLFLGDRQKIQSISIKDGLITLTVLTHAPDDPLCCPSALTTHHYRLHNGLLVPE